MSQLISRTTAIVIASGLSLVGCTAAREEVKPVVVEAPPPPPPEKTADELFAEGVAAFDAKDWDVSTAAFNKALEKNPSLVNARYNLGMIGERRGDLAGAQAAYEAAHAQDAAHLPTVLNLGKVYRLQGNFDQAAVLFEKAVALPGNEWNVPLLNNLTVTYRLQKQYAKAEATARKVLSRTKDNPEAYKNLSLVYYDQGNYRLAEFMSRNVLKLDDKDPGVFNNLGMIFLKMDDRARALGYFQKAVQLNAEFAPGHMNIGAMALSYRDYESAEKSLRKAVDLEPNSFEGHLYLAQSLDGQRGRDPKKGTIAGDEYMKVLSLRPELPEATCGAAWAYAADKSGWERALPLLEKCKAGTQDAKQGQILAVKITTLQNAMKAGQPQPAPEEKKKEAPRQASGDTSLFDKVSEQAAKEEAAAPAPAEGAAPAPAPAPEAAPPAPAPETAPAPAAP